jgi:recombination protein RecR
MRRKNLEKFYNLVEALELLPTIGKKSATRLAYFLSISDKFTALKISHAIEDAVQSVQKCSICGAMSEDEVCEICLDESRHIDQLCIVESAKDIFIIENSKQYNGRYYVLDDIDRVDFRHFFEVIDSGVKEVIFALSPSVSNDAIILYIEDKLKDYDLIFSKIAQGVPTGVTLENVDLVSISRAIESRVII